MRELDTSELSGSITAVPVVSLESLLAALAVRRPGRRQEPQPHVPRLARRHLHGRLARDIFELLIEPADVLLDLHGGDLVEALEPFALYGDEASRELALAFGFPYVLPPGDPLGGMTTTRPRRSVLGRCSPRPAGSGSWRSMR